MKYVGIDLHKKTISGCVVIKMRGQSKVLVRQRLEGQDEAGIKAWFSALGKFEVAGGEIPLAYRPGPHVREHRKLRLLVGSWA